MNISSAEYGWAHHRLTEAVDAFRSLWESVQAEIHLIRRDDIRTEYSLLLTLGGDLLERGTILVVHLDAPWSEDYTYIHLEAVPAHAVLEPPMRPPFDQIEHQIQRIPGMGMSWCLKRALEAHGIPARHTSTQRARPAAADTGHSLDNTR